MTATAVPSMRQLAADLVDQVDEAQRSMLTSREIPASVETLIDQLADRLVGNHAEWSVRGEDPYLGQALLSATLAGEKGLRTADENERRRQVRLALEQVRQVLRDLLDQQPAAEETEAKEVVRWVNATLSIPQAELAALLGVHPRTLQRWLADDGSRPEGNDEARVRMVARTVAHLRHVFTGPGVVRWFGRPHPELQGRRPADLLDDPLDLPQLMRLASRTRTTTAT